jgi:hypothetical protein
MLNKKLEDYKQKYSTIKDKHGNKIEINVTKKCNSCGHHKFYWDKARNFRTFSEDRKPCSCVGYSHPHRPRAKFCVQNKDSEFNTRVLRHGENPLDVKIDIVLKQGGVPLGPNDDCPF